MQGIAVKLGAPIKNQRLADIVAHRPQAAVRSLKWLLDIIDNVLKQADTSLKKGARMLSVPDLAFGGFQRKYGDLMASEYMASLVNSVAKYRLVSCHIHLWVLESYLGNGTADNMSVSALHMIASSV